METKRIRQDMISLAIAQELKEAGLPWRPGNRDHFMIPDRDLDDTVFVITNMAVRVQRLQGYPAITFQGAYEWALDYIFVDEVVWMPTEGQLRTMVERRLKSSGSAAAALRLTSTAGNYSCEIYDQGTNFTFSGHNASTAYARALLHLMQAGSPKESIL